MKLIDPNYDSVKVEETDDPNKKTRTVEKKVKKWTLMNEQRPIWLRSIIGIISYPHFVFLFNLFIHVLPFFNTPIFVKV